MRRMVLAIWLAVAAFLAFPAPAFCEEGDVFESGDWKPPEESVYDPSRPIPDGYGISTQPTASLNICPTGTAKDPRSGRCLVPCADGRLEVRPGQCCWPGQDVGATSGRCVGAVAYCPAGTLPNPYDVEDCVRSCPDGRIEVAPGHCCWLGQTWDDKCVGVPTCPVGRLQNSRNPTECARLCTGGRLEVAPGHCCRPGEAWSDDTQKCVGAATCAAGTMANPLDVTQCLGICNGVGLEVAPGHCCWPGQHWNVDRGECFGPALACVQHMRLSPHSECLSVDGPCDSSLDCDAASACLAGRCVPGRRFRRVEVFADGAPIMAGLWSITDGGSTASRNLASGGFSSGKGIGLSLRASWAIHPRWSVGGYLGYLRVFDGRIDIDKPNDLGGASRSLTLSAFRAGALGSCRWPLSRSVAGGVGLELGLLAGTADGGDVPFGGEIGPDLFFDIPLGPGTVRPYLTLSFGFRAGTMDRHVDIPDYSYAFEWWYYVMPVIRLGLGFGR